jgi:hypothetical protein
MKWRGVAAVVVGFAALALWAARGLLVAPGLIGLRHDWPIPPYREQFLQAVREHFFIWSERSMGTRYNLYGLPLTSLLFNTPAVLGLDGVVQTRLILLGVIAAAGCSAWFLGRTLNLRRPWVVASSLFYVLTPVLYDKIVSGYIHYMVSYALLPAALALFVRSTRGGTGGRRDLALAGIGTGLTFYQPQFAIMAPLTLLVWTGSRYGTPTFRPYLRSLAFAFLIAFGINATLVVSAISLSLDSFDTSATFVGQTVGYWSVYASRATNLLDSLVLVDRTFFYFLGAVLPNPALPLWVAATALLFGLVYGGTALRLMRGGKRRRLTLFFLSLALTSAWFGKGLGEPLGDTTFFLFVHVPPVQAFREFGHVMALGALGNAGLLGLALERLHQGWRARGFPSPGKVLRLVNLGAVDRLPSGAVAATLTLALVVVYGWPTLSGDFAGNVQTYSIHPEMHSLYLHLASDPEDYRVLWIPMVQPITYPGTRYAGIDPILLWSPKPTFHHGFPVNGALGPLTQFISSTLRENRTEYLGDLLALTSTRYILLRDEPRTAYQNFSAMGILDRGAYDRYANESRIIPAVLEAQRDLHPAQGFQYSQVKVWENPSWLPHLYAAERTFLVVGDLATLVSLSYLKELPEMVAYVGPRPAFLFLSQLPAGADVHGLMERVDGVIVDGDHLQDLALALMPEADRVVFDHLEAYSDLGLPATERWARVQQFWFWRDWHYVASLDDPVMAIGDVPLHLPLAPGSEGEWDVYVKATGGPRGAPLELYRGEESLGRLNLTALEVSPRWYRLGNVTIDAGNRSITLVSRASEEWSRLQNPSFEEGWDVSIDAPVAWSRLAGQVYLDPAIKGGGDFSVRLEAAPGSPASSLVAQPAPALGGARYVLKAWMKNINAEGAAIALEGFDARQDAWVPLTTLLPNASRGTSSHFREVVIDVPETVSLLRPTLVSGVPANATRGSALTWFDEVTVRPDLSDTALHRVALVRPGTLDGGFAAAAQELQTVPFLLVADGGGFRTGAGASGGEALHMEANGTAVQVPQGLPGGSLRVVARTARGPLNLTASVGDATVDLSPLESHPQWAAATGDVALTATSLAITNGDASAVLLDLVAVYATDRSPSGSPAIITGVASKDPTRYQVEVSGGRATTLVFNDAFDRWWRAKGSDGVHEPYLVNGGMMGFWIDLGEGGSVVLEHQQQRTYAAAVAVTVATLASIPLILAVLDPRTQRWWAAGQRALRGILQRVLRQR